jgi:hypothetical protein
MSKIKQQSESPTRTVLSTAAKFTPEERIELLRSGIVIPHAADDADPLERVWGYRCRHCNGLSLTFLGSRFIDGQGNEVQEPPQNVPIAMLPWVQDGDPTKINRHAPCCQNAHCGQPVNLDAGKFVHAKLLVNIQSWQASRAAVPVRRSKNRMGGTSAPEALDESWPKTPKVGDLVASSTRQRAESIAAQHGLDGLDVQ